MSRRLRPIRGFTLLELILAMALVAIISVSLYASLAIAWRAKRTAEEAVRPARASILAADLVCQDLESALPPTGILAGPFIGTQQNGTSAGSAMDLLDFYCVGEDAPPAQQNQPLMEGIRHVELSVRTDVDPPVLVRRVTRNLLATTQDDAAEEILCRGVRSFALRYFDGNTWSDEWDSTTADNVLPTAVELTLEIQSDPSLTAAQAQDAPITRITRLVPLTCGRAADQTDSTTTGGAQ
jgi:type II secretion system protein J